jgi:hypothetical protein
VVVKTFSDGMAYKMNSHHGGCFVLLVEAVKVLVKNRCLVASYSMMVVYSPIVQLVVRRSDKS